MDTSTKKPLSRASAFALAISMCAGTIGSNFIGTGLDSGLVDTFTVNAAGAMTPGVYYDAGTMQLNAYYNSSHRPDAKRYNDTWMSSDVTSILNANMVTLPGTTDINKTNRDDIMMCYKDYVNDHTIADEDAPGAKFGVDNNSEGMLYNYIAKGTAKTVPGTDEVEIEWEIRAWRAKANDRHANGAGSVIGSSKDTNGDGFVKVDELGLTSQSMIETEWNDQVIFDAAAPVWASGNTNWTNYKNTSLEWDNWLKLDVTGFKDFDLLNHDYLASYEADPAGVMGSYQLTINSPEGSNIVTATIDETAAHREIPGYGPIQVYNKHKKGCAAINSDGTVGDLTKCTCTFKDITQSNDALPSFNIADAIGAAWERSCDYLISQPDAGITAVRLYDITTEYKVDVGSMIGINTAAPGNNVSAYFVNYSATEPTLFSHRGARKTINGVQCLSDSSDAANKLRYRLNYATIYSAYDASGHKTDDANVVTTRSNICFDGVYNMTARYDTTSDYQRSGGTIKNTFVKSTVTAQTDAYIMGTKLKVGDPLTVTGITDEVTLTVSSSDATNARFYKAIGQVYAVEPDGRLTEISGATNGSGTSIEVPAGATTSAVKSIDFTFDASNCAGKTLIVMYDFYDDDDTKVGEHRNANDDRQKVYFPGVTTNAVDSRTQKHTAKTNVDSVIIDTVSYTNLMPGSYVVKGTLHDRATGSAIPNVDGDNMFIVSGTKPQSGKVEVEFSFDSTAYTGKELVVFEQIFACDDDGNETLVASHADINDANQTVAYDTNIFEIENTVATSVDTKSHIGAVKTTCGIQDEISLTGVRTDADATYTITGEIYLVDDEGNATPFSIDGKPVTKTDTNVTFKSETAKYVMTFDNFDSTGLAGKNIVIYETVTEDATGKSATHKDPTSESQTIWFPSVDTVATDKLTEAHNGVADGNSVTVVDEVVITNLLPNETYALKSVAMYRDENGLVGEAVSKTSSPFTATKSTVSMTIELTFDPAKIFSTIAASSPESDAFDIIVCEYLISGRGSVEYVKHYDLADTDQTVNYARTPSDISIETDAIDLVSGSQQGIVGKSNIQDTITYANAKKGKSYIAKAALMIVEDGNVVPVKDSNGNAITNTKTFVSSATGAGTVEINVAPAAFDTTALAGKTVIVFEYIYEGTSIADGAVPAATHASIADERQMVHYPSLDTVAKDKDEKSHIGFATDKTTIVDTVSYTNLIPGESYTLTGTLMTTDDDGKTVAVQGKDEKNIEVTTTFQPAEADGEVTMTFIFDATGYAKRNIVVFESLSNSNKKILISHNDMTDTDQTVFYKPNKPSILTTAVNGLTKYAVGKPVSADRIIDTVDYMGLEDNTDYVVFGELYKVNTATGNVTTRVATGSTAFTTTDSDEGHVDVEFKFDSSSWENVTVVAYERVYLASAVVNGVPSGEPVAAHEDAMDAAQQVVYADVSTEAVDATTFSHSGAALKDAIVLDRVYYTNLDPNKEYSVTGVIYNKKTGLPLTEAAGSANWAIASSNKGNGSHTLNANGEVSSTVAFTPDATGVGYVDVKFTFDASKLGGKDIVVCETIYEVTDNKSFVVATHDDLNDMRQTISYPTIETYATGADGTSKLVAATESSSIMDEIKLHNLFVGQDYVVTAKLATVSKTINKSGETVATAREISGISATKAFTATAKDQTLYLDATFDATDLAGQNVVVLVYLETTLDATDPESETYAVLAHDDPANADETVSFPAIRTVASALNNQDKTLDPISGESFVDDVFYSGLTAGHTYKVVGTVVDKETGKTIAASGSASFTAKYAKNETEGSVRVTFTGVNLSKMAGRSIVIYESVYDGSKLVATHADISDSNQTLTVSTPSVTTVLAETDTSAKTVNVSTELALTDTIEFAGLIPGNTYVTVSTLVDKATGKALVDDKNEETVIASRPFVADAASLTVTADYSFLNMELGGKTIVAYADLYRVVNGRKYLVVSEHDLKNKDQSVVLTEDATCTTIATDKTSGSHTLTYSKNAAIVDKVSYKGLEPGKSYTVTATVYDKETEAPAEGIAPVTKTFVAKDRVGYVNVTIPVDATVVSGRTLVVFEVITGDTASNTAVTANGTAAVCAHEDIDDANQTIYVNSVKTVLTAGNGTSKVVSCAKNVKLIDFVTYQGLTPGKRYQVVGHILDREASVSATDTIVVDDAEELIIDGSEGSNVTNGGRVISTKIVTFVPKSSSGTLTMEFTVNTSALGGHHLVAFETIKDKTSGAVVGEHKDINSANQTVTVKTTTTVYTGDMSDGPDVCDDENCVICHD